MSLSRLPRSTTRPLSVRDSIHYALRGHTRKTRRQLVDAVVGELVAKGHIPNHNKEDNP